MVDFKSFDWRALKKFLDPKAADDLNVFLEKLPQTAGQTVLIAAGIAWTMAAGVGLYTAVQLQTLTELRAELKETSALQPIVPRIKDVPVNRAEVEEFTKTLVQNYPGLSIKTQGAAIYIAAASTANFGQFREAISHVQNGGSGWRVSVERLCAGRECTKDHLAALLKINKVSVDKPS
ncbi:MAG: hypothetical protein H6868_04155 [Rhodospirillales bacterium]|nr:hypothetical protein [Rhodospirillales bacterium]